eukprot:13342473-Ditylum_brightwellii.AAC.3
MAGHCCVCVGPLFGSGVSSMFAGMMAVLCWRGTVAAVRGESSIAVSSENSVANGTKGLFWRLLSASLGSVHGSNAKEFA